MSEVLIIIICKMKKNISLRNCFSLGINEKWPYLHTIYHNNNSIITIYKTINIKCIIIITAIIIININTVSLCFYCQY